jgi:G3E family GTPase
MSGRDGRTPLSLQAQARRVPVLLVTGFLGSGKTTLVNRLLKTRAFARAAVIVNEFGQVSVDHELVEAPRYRMRVIDSGCLCGHVHEEMASTLLDLHAKRGRSANFDFDCVLIEMSGLTDPVSVIQILLTDRHITEVYELTRVIALADGVHGMAHLADQPQSVKQAVVADTIIISKTDLAACGNIDALARRLTSINPGARQLCVANGELRPEELLSQSGFCFEDRSDAARAWLNDASYAATVAPASANNAISTFALAYDEEITLPGFVLWMNLLAGFRGAGLLRVKGIVNVEGRPYAVQAVQTIVSEPVLLENWPDGADRRSRLVFITRGVDADDIRRTFATFRFDVGRSARNTTLNPETCGRFAEMMQLFRTSPARATATELEMQ